MLTHLSIRNIVLVEKAEIPFESGLNVLTGETGAGKSILLDALGLALGQRADAKLVRAGEADASVVAAFSLAPKSTSLDLLDALGIAHEGGECVIRRSLSAQGKSKCFLNDQPISARSLKQLGETLIEVHGQHEQRGLSEARHHLELLDAYGALSVPRAAVAKAHAHWRVLQDQLAALVVQIEQAAKEQDYLEHLVSEIGALAPESGEADALAEKRTAMMQGEKMAGTLQEALGGLQGETSAASMLRDVQRLLLRKESAMFEGVVDALERAQVEVQGAEEQLEQLLEQGAYNPHELERTEERLFAIKAVARKYNVAPDDLADLCESSRAALSSLANDESERASIEQAISEAKSAYLDKAEGLSQLRQKAALKLEKALLKELAPLKMDKCRFRVAFAPLEEAAYTARGIDQVCFEAATNSGQPFAPLQAIASGGELSRFMLALKAVLSSAKSTPTMIFDEIDTGTGGAVAAAIGSRLAMLSGEAQVLVVTHSPQVAAQGNHHLFIEKLVVKGATQTHIRALDECARKEELARMLAGEEVTDEARSAANKLLEPSA